MFQFLDRIPVATLVVIALTLGLAPFLPEPHVWEKLKMLHAGSMERPIDMFDLVFHGVPWLLLIAKLGRLVVLKRRAGHVG
ncbi:RND transporter [Cohaesibacter sp. CAU 1516]|uniref:RND transporter n=1 Tax=Cohaesibacter sp. CAU 1516 TaxID=2576038 RepID=UPI0010FF0B88|nr:RND transporter [Cohaesibacter sp. CAU 1516]TLP44994.1 RND transporter [Cohaesibacter sp. CAU 1516]